MLITYQKPRPPIIIDLLQPMMVINEGTNQDRTAVVIEQTANPVYPLHSYPSHLIEYSLLTELTTIAFQL